MFPLSHLYVTSQVSGTIDSLQLFGSVFPDGAWIAPHIFPRDQIHDNPQRFHTFVIQHYPQYQNLSLGVMLHSSISKGAYFYSDNMQSGFAVTNTGPLVPYIKKYIGAENQIHAIIKAHNFIEAAIDLQVAKTHPEISNLYHHAFSQQNYLILVQVLKAYLPKSLLTEQEILNACNHLASFLPLEGLTNHDSLIDKIMLPLVKLKNQKEIGRQSVAEMIDIAIELVAPHWQTWLNHAVVEMKQTFTQQGYLSITSQ